MSIHLLIQRRRLALGLTLHDLAKRLQKLGIRVDHASLSRLENGKRDVRLRDLKQYAIALECHVLDLLEESPE